MGEREEGREVVVAEGKWWLQRESQLRQYMQGLQSNVKCMLIKNEKVRKKSYKTF